MFLRKRTRDCIRSVRMDECEDCEAFVEEKEDEILEMAVYYILKGRYESNLSKDKKRAVRKRARSLSVEDGEVFMRRKKRKVRVSSVLPVMLILLNHHYVFLLVCYKEVYGEKQ